MGIERQFIVIRHILPDWRHQLGFKSTLLTIMYNMSGLMKKIIAKLLYETKVFVTTAAEIKH